MGLGIVAQKREKMARQERRTNFGANDRFAKTEKVVAPTESTKPAYIEAVGRKVWNHKIANAYVNHTSQITYCPPGTASGLSRSIGVERKGRRSLSTKTYGNGTRHIVGNAPVSADAMVWAAERRC